METLEGLTDALRTTRDIQSIVRTMKSLSAASIRQYEQAEAALADYEGTIEMGLMAVLHDRRAQGLALPHHAADDGGGAALIVIGSDRGLCGRYNETITRFALDRLGRAGGHHAARGGGLLAVIGARAAARLTSAGHAPDTLLALPGGVGGLTPVVQRVIVAIDRWTRETDISTVRLVHNRRDGPARAVPVERKLLPLAAGTLHEVMHRPWPGRGLPCYRMAPAALVSWLVQQRLFVLIYRALAEALASEHATRLAAMQTAERNIQERRDDLTSAYRRKRQETITRELMDVISGFEAVSTQD